MCVCIRKKRTRTTITIMDDDDGDWRPKRKRTMRIEEEEEAGGNALISGFSFVRLFFLWLFVTPHTNIHSHIYNMNWTNSMNREKDKWKKNFIHERRNPKRISLNETKQSYGIDLVLRARLKWKKKHSGHQIE